MYFKYFWNLTEAVGLVVSRDLLLLLYALWDRILLRSPFAIKFVSEVDVATSNLDFSWFETSSVKDVTEFVWNSLNVF
jgi:hypothetical protein